MTESPHRLVSARKSLIAAILMALALIGTAGMGTSASAAVCEDLALDAGMSSNARSIVLIEGTDPANCSTANEALADLADAEANLPPSSRANYRAAETADAEANLPPSSRADYQGAETVVAGVQEAPVPELPVDLPHGPE